MSYRRNSAHDSHKSRRGRRRRRSTFPGRVLKRFALPLMLILCVLTYLYPEQARTILNKTDLDLPVVRQVLSRISREKENRPIGSGDMEVHFIDVGEGLSVLVRSDSHAMLYDGGDSSSADTVISYLEDQGVHSLDYVIASHYDADHLSGLIDVLYQFPVGQVMGPDYTHDTLTYTSFTDAVEYQGLSVYHPSAGEAFQLGNSVFTVLAPTQIDETPNNNSIVLRLENGSSTFLFMGDAEYESEESLCYSGYSLTCDVLCIGHHGSSNSTSALLLDYAQPYWGVISVGAGNDYGHPHERTLRRLQDAGVEVYRTDHSGTIVAYSDGTQITWQTQR